MEAGQEGTEGFGFGRFRVCPPQRWMFAGDAPLDLVERAGGRTG